MNKLGGQALASSGGEEAASVSSGCVTSTARWAGGLSELQAAVWNEDSAGLALLRPPCSLLGGAWTAAFPLCPHVPAPLRGQRLHLLEHRHQSDQSLALRMTPR